jgi:putative effector of murein hydrolase
VKTTMSRRHPKSAPRGWWAYEHKADELAPRSVYFKRLLGSLVIALAVIVVALLIGIAGYHYLAGFNWIDSLLEASMILGGMGPVSQLPNDPAKIFASIYALFSGLVVLALMGIMLGPVVHRVLHQFHVDEKDVE